MQRECACRVQLLNIRMWYGISRTILRLLLLTTVCARFMKIRRAMCGSVQTTASTSIRRVRESCSTSSSMTRPASILPPGLMISFRISRAGCGWHLIRVASSCWTSSAFWQPSRSHLQQQPPVWQIIISQIRARTLSRVCTSDSWCSMAREWFGLPLIITSTVSIPVPFASPISQAMMPSII